MLGRVGRLCQQVQRTRPQARARMRIAWVCSQPRSRLLVDRAGPRVGVARGGSECDERLAQAHGAGPAKRDRARLPELAGHRRGAALGSEVITRHEPRTVGDELGEQGRGTAASLAEQRRDDLTAGVRRRRARRRRGAGRRGDARAARRATTAVRVPRHDRGQALLARRARRLRGRVAVEELERDRRVDVGEDLRPRAQSCSSRQRSWFASAPRCPTRSSRTRTSPRRALVASDGGAT